MRRCGPEAGLVAFTIGGAALTLSASPALAGDATLAAFGASIELALVSLYAGVAQKLAPDDVAFSLANTFGSHHRSHADAWNKAAGVDAVSAPNPKLAQVLGAQLKSTTDRTTLLTLAYGVENKAAATYQFALETLLTDSALRVAASILPVESQHAVVIGRLLGRGPKDLIPLNYQTDDGALDQSAYPVHG
jgi:hypothetical protein